MSEVNCVGQAVSMDKQDLKKRVLGAKKMEWIIFFATPDMKRALERIAHERSTSVSALLTSLVLDEVITNKEFFDGSAE